MHVFLITILLFVLGHPAYPKNNASQVLKCLAKEEEHYHKTKNRGHLYRLNQKVINQLSENFLELSENETLMICRSPERTPPSISFLSWILLKDSHDKDDLEIQKLAKKIFFELLADLQSQAKSADCLETEIPELKKLNKKILYLEGKFPLNEIISEKKQIKRIFQKLRHYKKIIKKCSKK